MRASGSNHLLMGSEVLVRQVDFCDAVGIFCRKRVRKTVPGLTPGGRKANTLKIIMTDLRSPRLE
jgi:hypothetical protein